jgi:signal peptidase I
VSNPNDPLARLDPVPEEKEEQATPTSDGDAGWPPARDPEEARMPWAPPTPVGAADEPEPEPEQHKEEEFHHPLDRVTKGFPRRVRIAIDWIVTIVGAIAIVLAIKAWVVNPYRIPSSSMEPTLHCARPEQGCEARFSDRVLANRFIYHFRSPHRGEIVVFKTPPGAEVRCGAGGTFVKRLIGLPGETVKEDHHGFIWIEPAHGDTFYELREPYIQPDRRLADTTHFGQSWTVPPGYFFFMGDNRAQSCDSREWGSVPRKNLIGTVFFVYWPPNRLSFK